MSALCLYFELLNVFLSREGTESAEESGSHKAPVPVGLWVFLIRRHHPVEKENHLMTGE